MVERLLAERVSLWATGRSHSWLQRFANDRYRKRTPHAPGQLKKATAANLAG